MTLLPPPDLKSQTTSHPIWASTTNTHTHIFTYEYHLTLWCLWPFRNAHSQISMSCSNKYSWFFFFITSMILYSKCLSVGPFSFSGLPGSWGWRSFLSRSPGTALTRWWPQANNLPSLNPTFHTYIYISMGVNIVLIVLWDCWGLNDTKKLMHVVQCLAIKRTDET